MNHFHSLRNNQENYTAENEEYQTVEPFSMADIVDYTKKNANESYYFLYYTGIFIILFIIIVCVCANPKLIVLNGESNSVLSIVSYIAILGVYLGAIYYYTHISIFYFPESWERFTFIGYGAVLFILVVVFGVMGGIKFEKVKKMLNALGPYKQIEEIQQKRRKVDQKLEQNEIRIMKKLTNELQKKQTKVLEQERTLQAKKIKKQIELQQQEAKIQAKKIEKQIELRKQKNILKAKAIEEIQRANAKLREQMHN
jgi:Skp family chaperone for outer membrane proteins